MIDFGNPFEIRWGPKWHQKSTKWRKKCYNFRVRHFPFCAPLFSRNHSNPRAVGTSWLLKGHFFDDDWLLFHFFYGYWLIVCFCCVSLCSVLYNIFFFQKTSVNAQPMSPPFFEEIAAHKKIIVVFFSFLCLRLSFFYSFIVLLIFGYPLPTPWARFVPFWIDFGAIFGSTFPRFPPPAPNSCRDFARNFSRTCRQRRNDKNNETTNEETTKRRRPSVKKS